MRAVRKPLASLMNAYPLRCPAETPGPARGEGSLCRPYCTKWIMTDDSHVTAFTGSMGNVVANGHTLYVNGKAMN
jgi:hypothetical protein